MGAHMLIREVVAAKGQRSVVTVAPGASVRELVALLDDHGIGALVVSGDGSRVEGIVSERDVVRHLHRDPAVLDAEVRQIMTAEVETCAPEATIDDLMTVMTQRRIRHVPVLEDGRLVGIVSIGDVVKHRIDSLQFERDQLDQYVHQS